MNSALPLDAVCARRAPAPVPAVVLRAVCALLLGAVLAACSRPQAQQPGGAAAAPPPEVAVVVLRAQSQQIETVLPGRTLASLSAEVRPQVSGIVQKRLFTEGALVRQGQPLYQLDAALLAAAQASAQAALARAEASARTLEATARRNGALIQSRAISQQAWEESEAAALQARADVAVARANLETARINLKYSRIEAPIGGRISLSSVTPGALVTANQAAPLASIVQLDPMYVDFAQSSTELLQLRRDWQAGRFQKMEDDAVAVRVLLDDGSAYPHAGRLRFSGVIVNASTGNVTLRAVVPNPDGVLMPGMYVQVLLPTGVAPEALLLPQQAVMRDLTGRAHVFVVTPEQVVQRRAVELDRAVGSQWLVRSGLSAGEQVVVEGFQRVQPGTKVRTLALDEGAGTEDGNASQAAAAQ